MLALGHLLGLRRIRLPSQLQLVLLACNLAHEVLVATQTVRTLRLAIFWGSTVIRLPPLLQLVLVACAPIQPSLSQVTCENSRWLARPTVKVLQHLLGGWWDATTHAQHG